MNSDGYFICFNAQLLCKPAPVADKTWPLLNKCLSIYSCIFLEIYQVAKGSG